jgi:hypothetical protein
VGSSSLALLWNAAVEARLEAWIAAMAAHLAASPHLERVARIVFNETSLGTKDTGILAEAEFDPYVYLAAIEANLLAATASAPTVIAFVYLEGGFVSMDGSWVNAPQRLGDWMLMHPHTGVGMSDMTSARPNTNHPCADPAYQGRIPCDPALGSADYEAAANPSIDQAFAYALSPAPDGLLASFMTFLYQGGSSSSAFTFADVSAYVQSHPMPNTAPPTW